MGAAAPTPGRLYIAVRQDLPVGLQMAQAVHAGFSYAQAHPEGVRDWMRDSQYLVIVSVPEEDALLALASRAEKSGVPSLLWREPDLGNAATALALAPVPDARRLCANLPLAGKPGDPGTPAGAAESGEPCPLGGWGLQRLEHYNDYPEWFDHMHPDGSPIRFATSEDAEAYLTERLKQEYREAEACYLAAREEADLKRELDAQRKAVLQDAGLWESPVDKGYPPLLPASIVRPREPVSPERAREKWRIVSDADMDEPALPEPGARCQTCGRRET